MTSGKRERTAFAAVASIVAVLALAGGLAACAAEGDVQEASAEMALTQDSPGGGAEELPADEAGELPADDPVTQEQEEPQEAGEAPVRQPRRDVQETIATYKKADPGIEEFFENAAGYVVFPGIGKGGLGVGAAHGNGEVIARGKGAIGKASMTQVTVGVQIGGQEYSEIIFFEEPVDLERFTKGGLELAAQVSAVAITAGAADRANYKDGVVVFTRTKSGMMGEASVGGQDFNYEAY